MSGEDYIEQKLSQVSEKVRYVAIEGVIGAGKTTLAEMLSVQIEGRLVLEEFEANPFLAPFYEDRSRWAFQAQLSFLASRFRQQQELASRDLFQQVVVSDYTFDKDRIFARVNLDGDEIQLYESLFGIMEASTPVPDLVVYLQMSTDRLMRQIKRRDRPYERDMDRDYIETLVNAYNTYFFNYSKSPLLVIQAGDLDFVRYPDHRDFLLREILYYRGSGTRYIQMRDDSDQSAGLPFDD